MRAEMIGGVSSIAIVTALATAGWLIDGVVLAIIIALMGVGAGFMIIDVAALPTDADCARKEKALNQHPTSPNRKARTE